MPRFVLLYHDCSLEQGCPSHWDLMFETGGVLRTWALDNLPQDWGDLYETTKHCVARCPELGADDAVKARSLPAHRRDYLEYEGPVSSNRGHVYRVDQGTYAVVADAPGEWRVKIAGQRIRGTITLTSDAPSLNWRLTFRPI